jgi:outer membrane protein assembly factor BamE
MNFFKSSIISIKLLAVLISSVLFAACSAYDGASHRILRLLTPYRVSVVQGNFISREAVAQLKAGMSREQVRFLLGTPLLTDIFHADRWDYVFTFKRGDSVIVHERRYTVYFEGDQLVKFGGDELPSEYELIAEIDGLRKPEKKAAKDDTQRK